MAAEFMTAPSPANRSEAEEAAGEVAPAARASRTRALFAGAFGNFVEWYDYSVYGFVATVIAGQFFPGTDSATALLAALAVFGLTFAARPIGAVVFGQFADRAGRRNVLAISVLMMAFSCLMLGVLPNYAAIGIWAPILLVVSRLLSGLSAGGEVGGSSSFLVEHAPNNRRGLAGSLQQFGIILGLLLGSIVGSVLGAVLTEDEMASWGWRLPFLAGAVLGLFGLYIRLRLEETPAFKRLEETQSVSVSPLKAAVTTHRAAVLKAIGFFLCPAVASYVLLVYMPTYAQKTLGLPLSTALLSSAISLAVLAALIPIFGALSDRVGRKPLMLAFTVGLALLSYPLFAFVSGATFGHLLVGQLIFAFLVAFYFGPGTAMYVEQFPTRLRSTCIGLSLGIATAIFGGTAPFLSSWLIGTTGNPMAPAFYLSAAAVVTFAVVTRLPETAHRPLATD